MTYGSYREKLNGHNCQFYLGAFLLSPTDSANPSYFAIQVRRWTDAEGIKDNSPGFQSGVLRKPGGAS